MSIARMSAVRNTDRKFTVIVDEYNDWSFKGIIFHSNFSQGMRYDSLLEMIVNMDCIMNEIGFPKQTFQMRSFPGTGELSFKKRFCDEQKQEGMLETFHIIIEYRNYASWQGIMSWENGKYTEKFESGLQLILLMNQILSGDFKNRQEVDYLDICHLAINEYDAGRFVGNFQNITTQKGEQFRELVDLAKTLRNFMEIRYKDEKSLNKCLNYKHVISSVASSTYRKGGKRATFTIKIMFRKHATWQGVIFWHEGKMQQSFRSFQEMLFMVVSVLGNTQAQNGDDNE